VSTLERALVSRLEAPPPDARDPPFQYLLGCGCARALRGMRARARGAADAR
jgi:hypothetical protein